MHGPINIRFHTKFRNYNTDWRICCHLVLTPYITEIFIRLPWKRTTYRQKNKPITHGGAQFAWHTWTWHVAACRHCGDGPVQSVSLSTSDSKDSWSIPNTSSAPDSCSVMSRICEEVKQRMWCVMAGDSRTGAHDYIETMTWSAEGEAVRSVKKQKGQKSKIKTKRNTKQQLKREAGKAE